MHDTTRTMVPTGRRPRGRLGINLRVVYYLYSIPSLPGGPLNKSALYLLTAASPSSAPWSGALLGLLLDPGALDRAVRGSKRLLWELTSPRKAWEHQDGLVSLHVWSLPALLVHFL